MKYAIYGVNRVARDFLYLFEELNIVCFFEDYVDKNSFMGKSVYGIEEIGSLRHLFDKLILCDFDKTSKINMLRKSNLSYKSDYVYESDFFSLLNEKEINPDQKKIVVWGTGYRAEALIKQQKNIDISFFIDTYKSEEKFFGKSIFKPEEIDNLNDYFIILAFSKDYEVSTNLEQKGMIRYKDYCNSHEFMTLPSQLLTQTIFDKSCYDINCKTMLNHCEVSERGELYCCCISFLYCAMGSLDNDSYDNIWNSNTHKIMCLSLENKTYSFCNKDMCPFFIGKDNKGSITYENEYKKMTKKAKTISVGFDNSCNLKCITCRKELYFLNGKELEDKKKYEEIAKKEMAPEADFVVMAGAGEVFCGPLYKDFYMSNSLKHTKWIRLLSNGTLFNKKNWNDFINNKTGKVMLTVSVDAATKETFEYIRSNGNFDVLKRNMEFAAELRKSGALAYFRMNFVVQRKNYLEMIPFVEWGLQLGVDEIFFTKIRNWGTYSKEEFKDISMMEEDGITPKNELIAILDNPIMKNPIVDLGTIRYAHEPVTEQYIDNYYRWELERKIPNLFQE